MPSIELFLAFLATTAVFAYIPGPAMLYAAAQTLARGRWSGLMASLGIHIGGYAHVFAAAAGLSVLFHAVPMLYLAVKLAGAAYLVWLGISLFRAKAAGDAELPEITHKSGRRAFFESITVEVLNPKTAIFFLAFLPQFIDASAAFPHLAAVRDPRHDRQPDVLLGRYRLRVPRRRGDQPAEAFERGAKADAAGGRSAAGRARRASRAAAELRCQSSGKRTAS
jgi:threonine/homoserine/homoserine lactone efflux protein